MPKEQERQWQLEELYNKLDVVNAMLDANKVRCDGVSKTLTKQKRAIEDRISALEVRQMEFKLPET